VGGKEKGMHWALQKVTFLGFLHSFPIFNAKIQDLPSLWTYKPTAFFTWLSYKNQNEVLNNLSFMLSKAQ
jgi:hypothetical protein